MQIVRTREAHRGASYAELEIREPKPRIARDEALLTIETTLPKQPGRLDRHPHPRFHAVLS